MHVWYNSLIKIDNKPYFNESLFNKGINWIQDFLDEHCNFVSYEVFNDNYVHHLLHITVLKEHA